MNKILITIFFAAIVIFSQSTADSYKNGMNAFNTANYSEAISIFRNFLESNPTETELYASANFYIAESHFNLKQNNAAAAYFENLVNYNKWTNYRELALFRLGVIYFEDGVYDKSRQNFRKLLSIYPGNEYTGSALYWIGESYTREGKTAEAVKFLEEAVQNKQNNKYLDNTIFSLASAYERAGDYENAVKYYDRLLSYHSNSPLAMQAQIRIGICYFKLKDYESSILELKNPALTNLPEELYSESLYLLANSYFRIEDYPQAEEVYREIIQNYPDADNSREVNYGLAWSLFQQKNYEEAFEIFDSLSEGEDSIAEKSFFWKAEAKRYSSEPTEAFDLYKEFMEKYPNSSYNGEVQFQMGAAYFNDNRPEVAERYLAAALKSDDPEVLAKAYTLKGEIDLSKKNFQSAKENFDQVMGLITEGDKLSYRAYLGLGTALYYLKSHKEAINYLTKLSKEAPEFETAKVSYYLAENLYAAGNYQEAITRYNFITAEHKDIYSKALYGKAYSYFNMGRYDQAAAVFSDLIKKYPNDKHNTDARVRLADSYYGSKDYASASRIYSDLFSSGKIQLNNPNAYFQYAQSLYRGGKTEEAIKRFYELREKYPNSEHAPRAYYLIGWIHFQRNEFDRAISQYRNTIAVYPGSPIAPVAYYSIGDAYYNMGRYDSAIVNYEKILTMFPGSPNVFDALNGIQYSYIAMDQPERAIEKLENYISDNPSSAFADQLSFKRGEIYYSNRSYEKAKNSYKSFLNNYKNSKLIPDAYFWIGKSAQNLSQNEEAVYNYNRVIELYPKSEISASAVIELSTIYNQMKNYDSSVKLLNQIAANTSNESPRKSEFLYLKGMTLIQKGDNAGAMDTFDEIVMYYKNSLFADKAKFERGLLELKAADFSSAERDFRELAETRSDDLGAKGQFYYGETLFLQNRFNEAITAFVRVRTVFSGYDEWLTRSFLRMGDSYVQLKENDKAADMYRTVLSRDRGDKYGVEAQKKLRAIQ